MGCVSVGRLWLLWVSASVAQPSAAADAVNGGAAAAAAGPAAAGDDRST